MSQESLKDLQKEQEKIKNRLKKTGDSIQKQQRLRTARKENEKTPLQ